MYFMLKLYVFVWKDVGFVENIVWKDVGFVENIVQKYDFQGGGVVSGRFWGRGWSRSKEKSFNRLLIHISNVDG